MRAVVWTAYGSPDVLVLQEIDKPTPADNELLIRIHATTVTLGDCEMRALSGGVLYSTSIRAFVGFRKPARKTILGMEFAGTVELVGKDVSAFRPGDEVFAATGLEGMGTCAEYIFLRERPVDGAVSIKPAGMSFADAAAVPVGGLEALYFIRKGEIQNGQTVLINGAGGTVGPYAVQLAKYFGAVVTVVDSADKLEALRSIGSDHVFDFATDDLERANNRYDFILDMASATAASRMKRLLRQGGRYIASTSRTRFSSADLHFLKDLIAAGKLRALVDRVYPLADTADAHRYVEGGGKVVITVD